MISIFGYNVSINETRPPMVSLCGSNKAIIHIFPKRLKANFMTSTMVK